MLFLLAFFGVRTFTAYMMVGGARRVCFFCLWFLLLLAFFGVWTFLVYERVGGAHRVCLCCSWCLFLDVWTFMLCKSAMDQF